jgi:predicted flap endonuclease-1-like 5' DNA nuclease
VLRFANMVDLYRVNGIGSEYAELLEAAGVDTVPELARRRPENLCKTIAALNADKALVRRPPTDAEVAGWVQQAKKLPRMLDY